MPRSGPLVEGVAHALGIAVVPAQNRRAVAHPHAHGLRDPLGPARQCGVALAEDLADVRAGRAELDATTDVEDIALPAVHIGGHIRVHLARRDFGGSGAANRRPARVHAHRWSQRCRLRSRGDRVRVHRLHGNEAEHRQQQQGGNEIGTLHRVTARQKDGEKQGGIAGKTSELIRGNGVDHPVTPRQSRGPDRGPKLVVIDGVLRTRRADSLLW